MLFRTKKNIYILLAVATLTLSLFLCFTLLFKNNGRNDKFLLYHKQNVDKFDKIYFNDKKLSQLDDDIIDWPLLKKSNKPKLDCVRPKHSSNRLNKILKKIQIVSCRKLILSEACLLEENRLYPNFIQTECNGESTVNRISAEFNKRTVSIAFLILIRGRQIRQLKRLFMNIYRSDFSFFFYVDSCSNYTFEQLKFEFNGLFDNVYLEQHSSPIEKCGLSDDLDLTISALNKFLITPNYWAFDYLIKLNENDFPILPVDELSRFLAITYGSNFMQFRNISGLMSKTKLYSDCGGENRYFIGNGKPPEGISIESGPFNFMFTKQFVKHLLLDTSEGGTLISGVREWSRYQRNPSETFLQTYLKNSVYCKTLENHPSLFVHKLTPAEGDDRSTVPSSFHGNDLFRIFPDNNMEKLQFFAVGFDPTENQQIIDDVESIINPKLNALANPNFNRRLVETESGYKNFWLNIWTAGEREQQRDGGGDSNLAKNKNVDESIRIVARAIVSSRLKRCSNILGSKISIKPTTVTSLRRYDRFEGVLLAFTVQCGRSGRVAELEAFIRRSYVKHLWSYDDQYNVKDTYNEETNKKELLNLNVIMADSTNPSRTSLFRKDIGVFGTNDNLKLSTEWVYGNIGIEISVVWMDPFGYVKALQTVNVTQSATHLAIEPLFSDARLEPGLWKVQIVYNLKIIGETEFLVFPDEFHDDNQANEVSSQMANSALNLLTFKKLLSKFYSTRRICVRQQSRSTFATCRCAKPELPECENTNWSSYSADRKSDIRQLLMKNV